MKYIFTVIAGIITAFGIAFLMTDEAEYAVGAPATTIYQKTILPLADSTYELGTSTQAWLRGNFDELCLTAGTCITDWIAGGGGGGGGMTVYFQNGGATLNTATTTVNFTPNSFSVTEAPADTLTIRVATTTLGLLTTNVSEGSNLYYTDARVSSYMSASTTYSSLISFYTTPSGRITDGTGLTWSSNTLNCDTASGSVQGCLSATDWNTFNGKESVLTFSGGLTRTVNNIAPTTGYNIPLTASTTNWNSFYDTPSTRITAGTGIDWSGNTLNGVYTAGDALTLTGEDFDFDGGATPAGALGGTWASPTVDDDGHNHTSATLSGIDISSDTNLSADGTEIVLTGDALSLGTALTFTTGTSTTSFFSGLGYFTNLVVTTLANFLNVTITGLLDIGAGVLEIPNGTAPVADDVGEIAHDTTGNQLIVDDYVVALADQKLWSVTIASTSPAFISGGLVPTPTNLDGYTITRIQCHVVGGTSKVVAVEDASANSSEDITCATTNTTDDGSITNATYTASELQYIDFGATTGAVDYVSISVFGNLTRE